MFMKALLSIKPEFVEKIFSGEKQVEFRKSCFKEDVQTVVVYATMPVGKIVGEFEIETILSDSPEELWEQTKAVAGISFAFFNEYFSGREVAYGIKIKRVRRYKKALNPYLEEPDFVAPQSFRYIRGENEQLVLT